MVGPAFIRALYPPDAAPEHEPSANGDDIRAIKRGVARSGHWPWGSFDNAYSSSFAHGRSGSTCPRTASPACNARTASSRPAT